jgi:hypothetical protein
VYRKIVLLAFATLLIISSSAVGATAAITDRESAASVDNCKSHEEIDALRVPEDGDPVVSINQTDNISVARYTFEGTGGKPQFEFTLPNGVSVTNSSGFQINDNGVERKYNAEKPWIELALGEVYKNISYAVSEQSIVVPTFESSTDGVNLFFDPQPTGYAGSHFALIGDYRVGLAKSGCQRIQVISPTNADLSRSPQAYADAIAAAGNKLDIGSKYRVVTAFVAPSDTGKRNGFTAKRHENERPSAEFYISPQSTLTNPTNTWVHEYVHTRQQTLSPRWMSEGSATYFTGQISISEGWITSRQYDRYLAKRAESDGTPDASKIRYPAYIRGAFFFTQLEADLENTNSTVQEVFQELNTERVGYGLPDSIGVEDFERVVESETNLSVNYVNPMFEPVTVVYENQENSGLHMVRETNIVPWIVGLFIILCLGIVELSEEL